ncbi:aromatic acid/H+ symport family MFS transporter [Kribbella sp. NPDC050820]|uniref:MFS transporter n=1 Tax=Kribbella sp. NPDC050820 TaxID=3155408 RepID=UPI00340972A9
MTSPTATIARSRAGLWVVAICFVTIVFDGYDLIVYGAVVPSLLKNPDWQLTAAQAGAIGSYALTGMVIGTLCVGALTDIVGRRRIMFASIIWFSLAMGATALAPNPEVFGLLRFVTGLGLGGVVPTAIALTVEYAPPHRRNFNNALMFSGFSLGGVLAAVLAINLVPTQGFRIMFWIGMAPLVLVLPLAWKFLPESVSFLQARGRHDEAAALAAKYGVQPEPVATDSSSKWSALAVLFGRKHLAATILFGLASFFGLLLVYGLNTWLPQIMRQSGYPLGSSLRFLLVMNLGAIVGALVASTLADRFGSKVVTTVAFALAAFSIYTLSVNPAAVALYLLIAIAGLGTVGTQILVNGYVATHYPAGSRATALGWSLGVGRLGAIVGPLFGGWVLDSGLSLDWNFYGFAVPAVLGALVIAAVPRTARERRPEPALGTTPQTTQA